MKKVAIKSGYKVRLNWQWLDENYQDGTELCYLQTLTQYEKKVLVGMQEGSLLDKLKYKELIVPEYIQAIDIDGDQTTVADYMKIPDTVLYIGNIDANKGYIVDSDNMYYATESKGILTNKKGTEFIGIPCEIESLTIPSKVTKVNLTAKNQIRTLNLKANSLEKILELSYENLSDCKIVVFDKILEEYIEQNYKKIAKGDNICVASSEDPSTTYTVKNGAILSNHGALWKMLATGNSSATLSGEVKSIQKNAFSGTEDITSIILSKDGEIVEFEKECLNGSNIGTIRCYTQEQFDAVTKQIMRRRLKLQKSVTGLLQIVRS